MTLSFFTSRTGPLDDRIKRCSKNFEEVSEKVAMYFDELMISATLLAEFLDWNAWDTSNENKEWMVCSSYELALAVVCRSMPGSRRSSLNLPCQSSLFFFFFCSRMLQRFEHAIDILIVRDNWSWTNDRTKRLVKWTFAIRISWLRSQRERHSEPRIRERTEKWHT